MHALKKFDPLKSYFYNLAAASIYLIRAQQQCKDLNHTEGEALTGGMRCLSIVPNIPKSIDLAEDEFISTSEFSCQTFLHCLSSTNRGAWSWYLKPCTLLWFGVLVLPSVSVHYLIRKGRLPDCLIGSSPLLIRFDPCLLCLGPELFLWVYLAQKANEV